jgi:hypothetical protein
MKTYRNYRGVKIFRQKTMICGSDCKEDKNGNLRPCKPKYDVHFAYAGGPLENTLADCCKTIDDVIQQATDRDIPVDLMVQCLNEI